MPDEIERLLGPTWVDSCPLTFEDVVFTEEERLVFGFLHYVYIREYGIRCGCRLVEEFGNRWLLR